MDISKDDRLEAEGAETPCSESAGPIEDCRIDDAGCSATARGRVDMSPASVKDTEDERETPSEPRPRPRRTPTPARRPPRRSRTCSSTTLR